MAFVYGFKICVGHIGHFSSVGSNIIFPRVLMRVHWILGIFPCGFLHPITHLVSRQRYYVSTQNSDLESATDAIDVLQTLFDVRQDVIACAEDKNSLVLKQGNGSELRHQHLSFIKVYYRNWLSKRRLVWIAKSQHLQDPTRQWPPTKPAWREVYFVATSQTWIRWSHVECINFWWECWGSGIEGIFRWCLENSRWSWWLWDRF